MRHAFVLLIFWVLIGALVFAYLEGWTLEDAIYFAVISITTVGYGDIVPTTPPGRLFTVFFLLGGVGLALYVLSSLSETLLGSYQKTEKLLKRLAKRERALERREKELEEKEEQLEERERALESRVERLEKKLEKIGRQK